MNLISIYQNRRSYAAAQRVTIHTTPALSGWVEPKDVAFNSVEIIFVIQTMRTFISQVIIKEFAYNYIYSLAIFCLSK